VTIVASVKVRDGLVLATDSVTQISYPGQPGQPPQWAKAYANARKLFQFRGTAIGAVTWGLGNLGPRSVEQLVLEFVRNDLFDIFDDDGGSPTVTQLAASFFEYVAGAYNEQLVDVPIEQAPAMGFLVAGYSHDSPFAQEREFVLPWDTQPREIRAPAVSGSSWPGVDAPFVRLWNGLDPEIRTRLVEAGVAEDVVKSAADPAQMYAVYDGMPVQDAIDFAVFIVRTTIGYTTFIPGVPSCGEPLQVAAILPDQGFEWIARPDLELR
jgi:hypothetical protein